MIASQLYKRISYRAWQYIHIVTYVLFLMGLYHARNWGSSAEFAGYQVTYGVLALLVFIGFIYRTQYKLRQCRAGKFIVESVEPETHDTFTVKVKPTKNFDFIAGQFAFLRIENANLHARHPFTISNTPGQDTLNFTIKRAGRFTQAAEKLEKGDEIKVDGPFGTFILDDSERDIVFIAGGVGITPFMSMLESLDGQDPGRNITLLYGSRNQREVIFLDKLKQIKEPWFKRICVLSQDKGDGFESGYINHKILDKYVKGYDKKLFYICGPEALKDSVQKYLWTKGVSRKDIIIEDFFW
jgi:predicted ferric reductase